MRKALLALLLLAFAGCSASPSHPASPVGRTALAGAGPSAQQLSRGRWIAMPTAPIRLCDALSAWDGRELVVVEPGFPPCRPAAAAYDPRANAWKAIAAPPRRLRPSAEPLAAWGGGRLVLVLAVTGSAFTWSPATGRWHRIATVPAAGAVSVGWTASRFLVITLSQIAANRGTARVFALTGGRWARLPDLPPPARGRIVEAVTAADNGPVYALAGINVAHTSPEDMYDSGTVELLRLTATAWTRVPLSPGAPESQLTLTQADGALVAAGSACPGMANCTGGEDGSAALLRPGADPPTTALLPFRGVPYPRNITAGGNAVVVTYSEGLGRLIPARDEPVPGSSAIYDISSRTWLKGPTAPEPRADLGLVWSAYWTPYGVINLGQAPAGSGTLVRIGGWLLRPAH